MSDINKYDYKDLTPFKWFVLENFPFIEADFDAITNYQLYSKVVEYLNNTINAVNEIGNTVEQFTQNFINLKNYVDNYFSNLDVQEEINNKLDDLVEDGTLTRLIGNYVQPLIDEQNENIETFKTNVNENIETFEANVNGQISLQNTRIDGISNDLTTQTNRINQIANLPSGSTSGDAELQDIRVGYNGTTYANAGTAVRTQIGNLSKSCGGFAKFPYVIKINREKVDDVYIYTCTIPNGTVVFFNNSHYVVQENIDISATYNVAYANMNITFDTINKSFAISYYATPPSDGNIIIANINIDYNPYIDMGSIYAESNDSKPASLILGANTLPYFPTIDSTSKTITFPDDTIIEVNKLAYNNHNSVFYKLNNSNRVCDFSSLNTSAIKIFYDIEKNILVADYYYSFKNALRFVLIAELRTNSKMASISVPYVWDEKLFGIDLNPYVNQSMDLFKSKINPNINSVNHRGYNTIAPENTLPAFKLSKKYGFEYVECDVEFTRDGVPVILHDATINRTARNTDGSEIAETININDITYEEALTYDFGIWKGIQYAGTKIPTLAQFLDLCRKIGLKCYIELKDGSQQQIEEIVQMVKTYGMLENTTFISSSNNYLAYVKNISPSSRLGYITMSIADNLISIANGLKTQSNKVFFDTILSAEAISDQTIINKLVENDLNLEVWNVFSNNDINNANNFITGFTTDLLISGYVMYENNIN